MQESLEQDIGVEHGLAMRAYMCFLQRGWVASWILVRGGGWEAKCWCEQGRQGDGKSLGVGLSTQTTRTGFICTEYCLARTRLSLGVSRIRIWFRDLPGLVLPVGFANNSGVHTDGGSSVGPAAPSEQPPTKRVNSGSEASSKGEAGSRLQGSPRGLSGTETLSLMTC